MLTILVLNRVGWNPIDLFDQGRGESEDGEAYLEPGLFLPKPIDTISLGLALVLGTAGLPHILMRFFTVPDAKAARSSVVWAVFLIGAFYLMVTALGLGARAVLGSAGEEAAGKGGNLAAPLLAEALGGGAGTVGGDVLLAFIAAVAFATILAVVAGLVISASGAVAHDVWSNVVRHDRDSEHEEILVARIAALGVGAVAIAIAIIGGSGLNVSFMVGLAFAVAASANFPALLLALTWRRFNTTGAVAGVLIGVVVVDRARDHEPGRVARAGLRGLAVPARQPGDRLDPARVPRLLARNRAQPRAPGAPDVPGALRALGDGHRRRARRDALSLAAGGRAAPGARGAAVRGRRRVRLRTPLVRIRTVAGSRWARGRNHEFGPPVWAGSPVPIFSQEESEMEASSVSDRRTVRDEGRRTDPTDGQTVSFIPTSIADPGPLGLAAFATTTFVLSFFNAGLVSEKAEPVVFGLAFAYGGIAQFVAGMWEFRTGNTFGAVAFSSFGAFWLSFWAYVQFYAAKIPAADAGHAVGLYLIAWGIFTTYMFIPSLRTTAAIATVFFLLAITFFLLGIGDAGGHTGITKLGGWVGLATALVAWYASFAGVTNATFGRVVLPVRPLK